MQTLDTEELFHLALRAIEQQQHPEAIELLKQALARDPKQGRLHYLLGAEYAQIGLYDRAVAAMEEAISLDASLYTAVFQLGLLYLTQGQAEAAVKAWAPLEKLDPQDPLYLFSRGLQHLAKDEFDACREHLQKGIALNQSLPVLNRDMQLVLDQLPGAAPGTETQAETKHSSVFIQAYASDSLN